VTEIAPAQGQGLHPGEAPAGKRRPHRRDEVLVAAVNLFYAQGYHETTMEEIASAVGLTAGALYRHFEDKRDILDTAVTKSSTELRRQTEAAAAVGGTPEEVLDVFIRQLVAFAFDNRALAAVDRYDRPLASEEAKAAADHNDRLTTAEWVRALKRIRPRIPEGEARAMIYAAFGMVYSITHTDSVLSRQRLSAYLRKAVRTALLSAHVNDGDTSDVLRFSTRRLSNPSR
jgi:AcrR family transcriptional regulator